MPPNKLLVEPGPAMLIDLAELTTQGWTLVEGITSQADMLRLGEAIGTPVRAPNGELVKEIRRVSAAEAPPGSQSATYGGGRFPLHTDTVFWGTPVRYLVLRGYGDTRRPTTVMGFVDLTREQAPAFHDSLRRSVWRVRAGRHSLYCSLGFREGDCSGWRYDADLMFPANRDAARVHAALSEAVHRQDTGEIAWSGTTAAVLSNWTVLHGRGPEPPDEGLRVIERLYVR